MIVTQARGREPERERERERGAALAIGLPGRQRARTSEETC